MAMGAPTRMPMVTIRRRIRTRISRTAMADGPVTAPAQGGLPAVVAWLSPACPVGAFSFSHGLEWAVGSGAVTDAATLQAWIADLLEHGAGRGDAILLAYAQRSADVSEVAALARALAPSAERALETEEMGASLASALREGWGIAVDPAPYPVVLGQAAAVVQVPVASVLPLFLHAFAGNLVSAGIRLIPIGQTDGQKVLAALMPLCHRIAAEAETAPLDALGGCAFAVDIASMRHETQQVRLFRS